MENMLSSARFIFHRPLPQVSPNKMNSLEKICLYYVARNACRYRISDFKALNVYILRQLVSYLSAYQLNRLNDVFDEAGVVEVQRVWRRYFALHWSRDFDYIPEPIFSTDDVRVNGIEARRVYLERLFQNIIIDFESDSWPEYTYIDNLRELPEYCHGYFFSCSDSTELDHKVLQSELPLYAEHVQVLVVWATSPEVQYFLKESNLLKVLQRMVRRLDVYYINTDNFTATLELIRMLVQEGSVVEFCLFEAEVSTALLETLMRLVSGQSDERALDSRSDLVECPVVEVEKNRLLEDNASQWTDGREIGSCKFAGYENDGLDNPQITVMNDKSENSDIPPMSFDVGEKVDIPQAIMTVEDEGKTAEMNQRASLSSEECTGNHLYDIALTNSWSDLRCLSLEDPQSLRYANTLNKDVVEPPTNTVSSSSEQNSSHLGNSGSRFQCPAELNSEGSDHVGSGFPSPRSVSSLRSCSSFTLSNFNGDDTSLPIQTILARVLRNWPALRKLALIRVSQRSCGCSACSNRVNEPASLDASIEDLCATCQLQREGREEFQDFLYRLFKSNQLTHFVCCDADLGMNTVDVVTGALLEKQSRGVMTHISDTEKIITNSQSSFRVEFLLNAEGFFGSVCVNLSEVRASVCISELVASWIRGDRALRSLQLPMFRNGSFYDDPLSEVLQVLQCNQRLEELDVSGNLFDITNASLLVSALKTCPVLRKLRLVRCHLSNREVDRNLFVDAVSTHPSLTELNLEENYLKDIGCDLLKAICLQNRPFNYLNLSCNEILGRLLLKTCREIKIELRKRRRPRFPISELDLSSNFVNVDNRKRLLQMLHNCIDVFVFFMNEHECLNENDD